MDNKGEILIYQSKDEKIRVDVHLEQETVWLNRHQMAILFNRDVKTIGKHVNNLFAEGELEELSVVANFATTASDGKIYQVAHYNLDVIISVGYRVKSKQGTQFRIWATQRLKEYIIKGFVLNDERFKTGNSMNYFNELQERIREIRLSERFFYQKIRIFMPPVLIMIQEMPKRLPFLRQYKTSYFGPLVSRRQQNWSIAESMLRYHY